MPPEEQKQIYADYGKLNQHPGVTGGLDSSGNLKPTSDFRAIYAGLVEQWLGADGNQILPDVRGFQRPTLLK